MDLEREIENYLSSTKNKTTASSISFLIKLWNSSSVKSSSKYDTILNYFTKHLLPKAFDVSSANDDCVAETTRFFRLKHATSTPSSGSKTELLQCLMNILSKTSSFNLIASCLELTSNESFKDFFTAHLNIYCKLLKSVIKSFNGIENGEQKDEFLPKIITELYCFAKLDNFKELFLDHLLLPLSEATKLSSSNATRNLLNSIFFAALSGSTLEVFEKQSLTADKELILMEAFMTSNMKNPENITKMLKFMEKQALACDDDVEFLSLAKRTFLLLKSCEIDLAPVKRQEPQLFVKLANRVQSAIEHSKNSMDFAEFLEMLSAFISCDAFLFEKNIYDVLMDCMLREKSPVEMTNYETLLNVIVNIYGKDLNQFLKKLLKSMDERLENYSISKKRKRKTTSGSETEVTAKKLRLDVSAGGEDWSHITHIWPKSMAEQFAEIASGLNFAQSIKVWNQLNNYLASVLNQVKDSSAIDENMLFKIDFASNLLCELFNNTRLLEQLMYKREEITPTAEQFNQTQHLFYEIILNIEYNSRVMCAFLKLSRNYENFLMLFFYHHNPEVRGELDALFTGNQIVVSEWKIIQQRVKNFGKTEEKNHLNSLLIQKQQKNLLLGSGDVVKSDDVASIVSDEKQIEFLVQKANTRSFFINSLRSKELKSFVQFLTKLDDKELLSIILETVAQEQDLLDGFISELVQEVDDSNLKPRLEILSQLPLDCASDESKKKIFGELLSQKCSKNLATLIAIVVDKIFQNDSYKSFFKDYSIEKVIEAFNVITFTRIYHPILSSAARKLNNDTLTNFNWIVKSNNNKLVQILAQVVTEVPLTATGGVTAATVTTLKTDLICKMMESFAEKTLKKLSEANFNAFMVLVKLCSENSSALKDDIKISYIALLQKLVKEAAKSMNAERANLLLLTLKDVKKFSLSDELREIIVDSLVAFLKSKLTQRMSSEAGDDHQSVELEKQLFETLKPFKSNFQEGCLQTLRQTMTKNEKVTKGQLLYSFKIFNIAFQNIDQSSGGAIKNYTKFHDNFVPKVLTFDCADLIIQVLETNNAVLRGSKFQLDNTTIDEMLCLLTDPRAKPSSLSIDEFFRFYSAVGETLFLVANVRQNYFKSRVSQYFNVYKSFMEATYFYKNDQPEELSTIEVAWLLKLALQLENIMKMIAKNHSLSIKVTSLYVLSSIVSIFVKNPKTLSVGYKFKVNIKNICYQLLSTFDDKARKHVYSVTDETSREVYDGLFNELHRGSR